MPADSSAEPDETLRYRVTLLERHVDELRVEFKKMQDEFLGELKGINGQLTDMKLQQAERKPLDRIIWSVVGAIASAIGAGIVWAMMQMQSP